MDVASVKHYLKAIKAKQSALNARKRLVGGQEPHFCSRPVKLRAYIGWRRGVVVSGVRQ